MADETQSQILPTLESVSFPQSKMLSQASDGNMRDESVQESHLPGDWGLPRDDPFTQITLNE